MANTSAAFKALGAGLFQMAGSKARQAEQELNKLHDANMARIRDQYATNRQLEAESRADSRYQRRLGETRDYQEGRTTEGRGYQEGQIANSRSYTEGQTVEREGRARTRQLEDQAAATLRGEEQRSTAQAQKDMTEYRKEINTLVDRLQSGTGFAGEEDKYAGQIQNLLKNYGVGHPLKSEMTTMAARAIGLVEDKFRPEDFNQMMNQLKEFSGGAARGGSDMDPMDVPTEGSPGFDRFAKDEATWGPKKQSEPGQTPETATSYPRARQAFENMDVGKDLTQVGETVLGPKTMKAGGDFLSDLWGSDVSGKFMRDPTGSNTSGKYLSDLFSHIPKF